MVHPEPTMGGLVTLKQELLEMFADFFAEKAYCFARVTVSLRKQFGEILWLKQFVAIPPGVCLLLRR